MPTTCDDYKGGSGVRDSETRCCQPFFPRRLKLASYLLVAKAEQVGRRTTPLFHTPRGPRPRAVYCSL
ncbi:hypothetical protein K461DRAFT_273990 [Myriangium duriaei CBS 260.36]|uniref:Uncharacterized protein n=1 Tax=Myriangium duriaei CBS 260.36 TaxID=1168546 RepID=A0A9P4JA28_9PEZI|nr:hypothetical protein K461DRAFT_273990 [Myriangium duriaei CBS 260.36]